jgi:hypothetical protein
MQKTRLRFKRIINKSLNSLGFPPEQSNFGTRQSKQELVEELGVNKPFFQTLEAYRDSVSVFGGKYGQVSVCGRKIAVVSPYGLYIAD